MAYTAAALNGGVNGIAALGAYISFHTADPALTGANEVGATGGYARQQTTWGAAANGSRVGSQTSTTIPAGTTVGYWGLWTASTAGTFLYGGALSAAESFGSAGTLQHTPTLTVSN